MSEKNSRLTNITYFCVSKTKIGKNKVNYDKYFNIVVHESKFEYEVLIFLLVRGRAKELLKVEFHCPARIMALMRSRFYLGIQQVAPALKLSPGAPADTLQDWLGFLCPTRQLVCEQCSLDLKCLSRKQSTACPSVVDT